MKKWNSASIEEINLSETAHGYWGIHSDGNRAQSDRDTCQNKAGNYGTVYGYHYAHQES